MTQCGLFGTNMEILGVLNASFPPIFRNIGGAIAPPVPPALLGISHVRNFNPWVLVLGFLNPTFLFKLLITNP